MPPVRYDGIPWASVQIQEALTQDGGWSLIDTQALSPVDPDPTAPQARNITTRNATVDDGWYRVVFLDGSGGESVPSDAMHNSQDELSLPPSADAIRVESRLLRQGFPIPPTDPYQTADLENLVRQATSMVQAITWRLVDPSLGDLSPEGYRSEACPAGMVPIAVTAVARMAERIYVTTEPTFAQQVATGRRLRGFSAGPYSEQYFAPGEFARRGAQQGRPAVDQDDALDQALWALMTEDARDYFVWRSTGLTPPTGVATVFDYRRQSRGYDAGGSGWGAAGVAHGGPDGF